MASGCFTPMASHAHDDSGTAGLSAIVAVVIIAVVVAYCYGVVRRYVHGGRGVRPSRVACFFVGMTVLAAALFGPIERLSDDSFAVHMLQHMVLVAVAPPLFVFGTPATEFGKAARPFLYLARTSVAHPLLAFGLYMTVLWVWHVPIAFRGALRSEIAHAFEHATLFFAALLFWWCLLRIGYRRAGGHGIGAVMALVTLVHTGMLGALLTFAGRPLYALDPERVTSLGLTALEDQQLAGLFMWVPGGFVYLIAGLALAALWLRRAKDVSAPTLPEKNG
jgi:putative membrane protein